MKHKWCCDAGQNLFVGKVRWVRDGNNKFTLQQWDGMCWENILYDPKKED